ncbi:IclR family transcriptional regulator [Jannaschia sp. M317]|uniref:IclR family transcriptional regulator n=1 Tax=Jannaschia sp. M317 TaxID=2867011 RepID=UPI0021A59EEE|nr:IclR family transcriptional regulator [Jannaschia sp. M317]UWQ18269.1 IclR family transcriptional regulator [Jannaschia sp. M317]
MPEDQSSQGADQIPTNLRLLILLEETVRAGVPVSPRTLVEHLGLPKATIHRLLATAEAEGFLQRDVDGRSYGPGQRLRMLAANTLSSQRIRTDRLAIMKALADEIGETCNLATPGRYGMVYLDRVETHWPLRIQLPAGTQVPFHCTASGKMYLSSLRPDRLNRLLTSGPLQPQTSRTNTDPVSLAEELSLTRRRGYSTDTEEFMDDMVAIAVPIEDNLGRLLSTLSVHAPKQRQSLVQLERSLDRIRQAADNLASLVSPVTEDDDLRS